MGKPKVAVIGDDQSIVQRIVQNLDFLNISIGELIEKPREAYLKINAKEPRVAILIESTEEGSDPQLITQIKKVNPNALVMYICKNLDLTVSRELFRAGAIDVLKFPEEFSEFEKRLEVAFQILKNNQNKWNVAKSGRTAENSSGRVISIYSGKGGAGTTLIAGNLAHTIALKTSMKVLLIDLNLQFGELNTLFNYQYERNLGDLKPVIEELTEGQINNVLLKVESSGLDVLLSPSSPEEAENFTGEDIELLLAACRLYFDVIILDIPKELNEISISALNNSDHILYITNLERPAIMKMQSVLDLLERYHLLKNDNVALVVNKFSKKHSITIEELKKMTAFPIIGIIGDNFKILQSYINLGNVWVQDKKDKGKKGPVRDLLYLTSVILQLVGAGGE